MGIFDPNYKRLKLILIVFIFLTLMYVSESVLLDHSYKVVDVYTGEEISDAKIDPQNISQVRETSEGLGNPISNFIGFITFVRPDVLPPIMLMILAPVTTIFLIVAIYLTVDVIYDIIKALPFT